jgi:purine-binding chemotaxis protein CheW
MSDLAQTPRAEPDEALVVRAANELFALPGTAVREVMRWRAPTPVPGAPEAIAGIISQRGMVLAVVDLRLALGLPAAAPDRATRFVIAHHEATDLALLVDAVIDLAPLPAVLDVPPAGLDPARARLLSAVARYGDRPLAVLSLAALIAAIADA